jgi:hypothetical protein
LGKIEPCWKSITACYIRGFSLVPPLLLGLAVAGQKYDPSLGSNKLLPVVSRSSTSGCRFEVEPIGIPPTKTHMVVGAPRSYLTPRASTLACHFGKAAHPRELRRPLSEPAECLTEGMEVVRFRAVQPLVPPPHHPVQLRGGQQTPDLRQSSHRLHPLQTVEKPLSR